VWWRSADAHDVWAATDAGSSEAYRSWARGLQRLHDAGAGCAALGLAYERQQFNTPVVIGA
jgi:hypothetical protein